MTIGTALYKLLIGPLELLFETVFAVANRSIANPGFVIVVLSLAMNFLVLPLYRRADALQEAERIREAKMKPEVAHIRKHFKGDERFMILQAYYRLNGYHPTNALNGSFVLLLEIPFFIAAYRFLSNLSILQGTAFGPIQDLGKPDALIQLGGMSFNLLPLLMTAINLLSATVYMRGFPIKNKVQMVGIALVFLLLLYDSPAGLVFYWTLNNLFSLAKNICYKLRNPRKMLIILSLVVGLGLLGFAILQPLSTKRREFFVIITGLALLSPTLLSYFKKADPVSKGLKKFTMSLQRNENKQFFRLSCLFLTLLTGLLIPSAVIRDSPVEFIQTFSYKNPLWYEVSTFLLASGTFLVWGSVFYYLVENKEKVLTEQVLFAVAVIAAVDYMIFGKGYGNLSPSLVFDDVPVMTNRDMLLNLLTILTGGALMMLLVNRKPHLAHTAILAMCIAALGMGTVNTVSALYILNGSKERIEKSIAEEPKITLSRTGKNVVILMLDRGLSPLVPYCMAEKTELQEQFDGFTWYPNTISYGSNTQTGAPGIFGGYEYIPQAMNLRPEETLAKKHNEALRLLPIIFSESGFGVTVCDLPYANYEWTPDLSIFDDRPEISTYITAGRYTVNQKEDSQREDIRRTRNFFCYSLFKIAPTFLQPILYSQGSYNAAEPIHGSRYSTFDLDYVADSISTSTGVSVGFLNTWSVLKNLPEITVLEERTLDQESAEDRPGQLLVMANDTTHFPILLQEPDYEPANVVNNVEFDALHSIRESILGTKMHYNAMRVVQHYDVNMAALLQLGKWFDYLRENGVYNNTRIILVSDHAHDLSAIWDDTWGYEVYPLVPRINALLMIKDFNATGFKTDWRFMTNADTPTLAMEGLIDHPVNPETGVLITSDVKQTEQGHTIVLMESVPLEDGKEKCIYKEEEYYHVGENIFEPTEWTALPAAVSE